MKINKNNIQDIYQLSPLQEGILFHVLSEKNTHAYFEQMSIRIEGQLDRKMLELAWNKVFERHDALRTAIVYDGLKEPLQVVLKNRKVPIHIEDISHLSSQDLDLFIANWKRTDRLQGFDLSKEPLLRVCWLKRGDSSHELIMSHHHIILDGWSIGILIEEFFSIYKSLRARKPIELPEPPPFKRFIKWYKESDSNETEKYWGQYLNGFADTTTIPKTSQAQKAQEKTFGQFEFSIGQTQLKDLLELSKHYQVSLNTVIRLIWALLLARYNDCQDILFGATVSGRPSVIHGIERMTGVFINTLPIRVLLNEGTSLGELLQEIQAQSFEQEKYQHYSLAKMPALAQKRGSLFDHILVFENFPVDETVEDTLANNLLGFEVKQIDTFSQTNYDLCVVILPGKELRIRFSYNKDVYHQTQIENIQGHVLKLVDTLIQNPRKQVDTVDLLKIEEQFHLINPNHTTPFSIDRTLHSWFQQTARLSPNKIAAVAQGATMSYQELDMRSNQLAKYLLSKGLKARSFVGLLVDRSLDTLIGLLAILKAGAAYVPIDPNSPSERISYILKDSSIQFLITQEQLELREYRSEAEIIYLDKNKDEIYAASCKDISVSISPDDPAYIIYTSGTTGLPKGTIVSHYNAVRLFKSTEKWYQFGTEDKWTFFHSLAFDFSVWEIWGALLYGGQVHIISYETSRSPEVFYDYILENEISVLNQTPSAFYQLIEVQKTRPASEKNHLKWIIFGGEALDLNSLQPWMERHGDEQPRLINMYGITETTVHVTHYPIRSTDLNQSGSIIGEPIPDLKLYVLDSRMKPVASGVPGQLFVGGPGVSKGYLNRPELTAQRFVINPFVKDATEKLYRTGDVVRYRPDGLLEYIGRSDHQVKISGFRIEPGEIENTLLNQSNIDRARVIATKDAQGQQRLVAYVQLQEQDVFDIPQIRRDLLDTLPEYMIPSIFIPLTSFPMTGNGKVDMKALPDPFEEVQKRNQRFEAAESAMETEMVSIWKDVLGIDQVGVTQNFFELGGDSIRSIQVVQRAKKIGLHLTIKDIFQHLTIRNLVQGTEETEQAGGRPVRGAFSQINEQWKSTFSSDVVDAYPLSRMQSGMLFHSEFSKEATAYHDIFTFYIEADFKVEHFRKALNTVSERHDILRTSFELSKFDEPLQLVHRKVRIPLTVSDLTNLTTDHQQSLISEWIESKKKNGFELDQAPLLHFQIHVQTKKQFALSLACHHAILDGWSVATLLSEIFKEYHAAHNSQEVSNISIPELTYADFVRREKEAMQSSEDEVFWSEYCQEAELLSLPELPSSFLDKEGEDHGAISLHLDEYLSDKLINLADQIGVPLKTVLLAAHIKVLGFLGNIQDVVTGLVTNGRLEEKDGERVLGVFLNTLPLRVDLERETWKNLIDSVFREERKILPHRWFPMVEVMKKLGGQKLFETAFNYTHFHIYEQVSNDSGLKILATEGFDKTNFKLVTNFSRNAQTSALNLTLQYDPACFSKNQVEKFVGYFERVLTEMASNANGIHSSVGLLDTGELKTMASWSNPDIPRLFPEHMTIDEVFDKQVGISANRIAVSCEKYTFTYQELQERINAWAVYLQSDLGLERNDRIAVISARHSTTIVAMLATIKAGGCYVPIDPTFPANRIGYIVDDAQCKAVFCESQQISCLKELNDIPVLLPEEDSGYEGQVPLSISKSEDLAYLIYTSGSTGKPKGVMIEHHSVIHLVEGLNHDIFGNLGENKKVALVANFVFDASIQQIFATLFGGHSLFITSSELKKDPRQLNDFLLEKEIEVCDGTPSLLSMMVNVNQESIGGNKLQQLIIGGEPLPGQLLRQFYAGTGNKEVAIANVYGPTETAVDATCHNFTQAPENGLVPIGKPLGNTEIMVLGSQDQFLPTGVAGEICIGGAGVGRGYMNLTNLTNEKFTPHPQDFNRRIFRTGDLGRWLPNGTLEFIGRRDAQVKVNGYRIELEEINQNLQAHESVQQSTVIVKKNPDGGSAIIAFFVPASTGNEVNAESFREYLSRFLPDYMLPTAYVSMENIPLTSSGKVNRKLLEDWNGDMLHSGTAYMSPRNEKEVILIEIWQQVLGQPNIGIRDNFFVLGGDSIKALQIVARLKQKGFELQIKDLFALPMIGELSHLMEAVNTEVKYEVISGQADMNPIQSWFWEREAINPHHFNQSVLLGMDTEIDEERISTVLDKILEHHDILRATVPLVEGIRKLVVSQDNPDDVLEVVLLESNMDAATQILPHAERLQRSLSLDDGPLLKVGLFKHPEGDQILISIHHILMDGVSWRVLLEDLKLGYEQHLRGEQISFPPKTVSFIDWSNHIRDFAEEESLLKEVPYWKNLINTPREKLFPTERTKSFRMGEMKTLGFTLSFKKTEALLRTIHEAYTTRINDVLLTALGRSLFKQFHQKVIPIMMEGHGREALHTPIDISRTIGWFTSRFPVLLNGGIEEIGYHLKCVKEDLRQIPRNGLGYGILKYLTPLEKRSSLTFNLEPEIGFNYLGQFDEVDSDKGFKILRADRGAENDPETAGIHPMDVVGFVTNGQMQINISYSSVHFEEAKIANLLSDLESEINHIIDHCHSREVSERTPSDFGYSGFSLEEWEKFLLTQNLKSSSIQDIYPLSPMQEGIFFHSLMEPESNAYFEQISLEINGSIDLGLFEKTWSQIIDRHDILRSSFIQEGLDKPLQLVHKERQFDFQYLDLRQLSENDQLLKRAEYKKHDKHKKFDLAKDTLLRASILQLDSNSYELILSNHHIILDGWSISILFNEFFEMYKSEKTNNPVILPKVNPFRNYISWLDQLDLKASGEFWKSYLSDYDKLIGIPQTKESLSDEIPVLEEHEINFDTRLTQKLKKIADSNKMSLTTLLQGIWALVLGQYNDTQDVVFGITVSGRSEDVRGIEQMVGLFINTNPVRIKWSSDTPITDFYRNLQEDVFDRENHQYYPLADIQTTSGARKAIFDHLLIFENYPIDEQVHQSQNHEIMGFTPERINIFEQTNYGMVITIHSGEKVKFKFNYDQSLYESEIIEQAGLVLSNIAEQLADGKLASLGRIQLDPSMLQSRFEWKSHNIATIPQCFEKMAQQHPHRTAMVFEDEQWTYDKLNTESNRLANYLLEDHELKRNQLVALHLERSPFMLIGILGVLKAGGAYVPMSPDFPSSRIQYILEDSACQILLSDTNLANDEIHGVSVLDITQCFNGKSDNPFIGLQPSDLAYMTYTSGSTGKPKGIMVTHQNVVGFTDNLINTFGFEPGESILAITTYTFDISVLELLSSLMTGIKVVLASSATVREPEMSARLIQEEGIQLLQTTPSRLKILIDINGLDFLKSVRVLLVGGEAFPESLFRTLRDIPTLQIFNVYGPTETTIWSTAKDLTDGILNIGTPLLQEYAVIVNTHGDFMPFGATGEICITGEGVTNGYWNRPELTEEKFIKQPNAVNGVLYRTGDLGRLLPNGQLECFGRIDQQIKLRGYRIEPGEIESCLEEHPDIANVVCDLWGENGHEPELFAWIIPQKKGLVLQQKEMRYFLGKTLPPYMIPSHFVHVDEFPLNSSGKLDRNNLPGPEDFFKGAHVSSDPPETDLQKQIAKVWSEVLHISDIGLDDQFFELGGHSLKATQVISRLFRLTGRKISINNFFQNPTIRTMAGLLTASNEAADSDIQPAPERAYYKTSYAQKRLWLLDSMEKERSVSYNMPGAITFNRKINVEALTQAFNTLIERHESLRTNFVLIGEEPVQKINAQIDFRIPIVDLRSLDDPEAKATSMAADEALTPFDLEKDLLLRARLLLTGQEKSVFLFTMHHIISDGWSVQILLRELKVLYNAYAQGYPNPLRPLKIQYRDFTEWQNQKSLKEDEQYWLDKLKGQVDTLDLPYDYPRKGRNRFMGNLISLEVDREITSGLRMLANLHGTSLSNAVLTIFMIFLSKLTGQSKLSIAMSIANRNHPSIENLIGFFVNTLIIQAEVKEDQVLEDLIDQIKRNTYEAFEHQNYPFELLVKNLNPQRYYNNQPLFNVIFGFQNFQDVNIPIDFMEEGMDWLNDDVSEELRDIEVFDQKFNTSKFDISLFVYDHKDHLQLSFEYNSELFKDSSMSEYLKVFVRFLENASLSNSKDAHLIRQKQEA